jgi:hypothetical protein
VVCQSNSQARAGYISYNLHSRYCLDLRSPRLGSSYLVSSLLFSLHILWLKSRGTSSLKEQEIDDHCKER